LKVEHTGLKPTNGYTFSEFRLNAVQSLFRLCKRHGRPSWNYISGGMTARKREILD